MHDTASSPAHDGRDLEGRHAPGGRLLQQGGEHTQHARALWPDGEPVLRQESQIPVRVQPPHILQACHICRIKDC